MSKEKKLSFWEKVAYKQMKNLKGGQLSKDLYTLSDEEQTSLKKIRRNTLLWAALTGALGVILLNLPHYIFGASLFPERDVWIPVYGEYVKLEIEFLLYGLVLVFFEIWFLTFLNIKAVHKIAVTCGFPGEISDQEESGIKDLVAVSLDKKQTNLEEIGINPYEGLSKVSVFVYQTIIRLKAAVSGILFKLLIKRVLGRYAIRYVVELAGIPIYAFWNMYAAQKTMNEARVRVLAPPLIDRCIDIIHKENKNNEEFKNLIYNTLQNISQSKRSFHFNHYLLAYGFLKKFEIVTSKNPEYDKNFLENIDNYSDATRKAVAKLLVFGILLDGKLSMIEKRALKILKEEGALPYSIEEVKTWSEDFFNGKGLEALFNS